MRFSIKIKNIYVLALSTLIFLMQNFCATAVPIPSTATAKEKQSTTNRKLPEKPANVQKNVKNTNNINIEKKENIKKENSISEPEKQNNKITQDKIDSFQELRDQAKLLYNSNNLSLSEDIYKQIPDSEKTSEDWLILANISQDKGKDIDAVFYLKKAIQADDKNYKAHYNLGNIYFADNKINMALSEYRKVLRIKKDYPYAYYNKGCCYLKKKSYYNARYEFGLAIKAKSDDPVFYYNLAYTYKMLKKPKKAQEALDVYNALMSK